MALDFSTGTDDGMRVISRKQLREFASRHPDAESSLRAWFHEARQAHGDTTADIKQHYGSASVLKDNRVVFNICGNKYRLVVKINYHAEIVYVRFVGTHADYDKIDAEAI
jgi:mRNA interferase HigB